MTCSSQFVEARMNACLSGFSLALEENQFPTFKYYFHRRRLGQCMNGLVGFRMGMISA